MPASLDTLVVGGMLLTATLTDLRSRQVPCWITFGGIASGVAVSTMGGHEALSVSLAGMSIGGSIISPFVLIGAFGAADALLLAAIGAWTNPVFVLWTVWWASLTGATIALIAWHRGQTTIPYVPAIATGAALAFLSS